MAILLVLLWHYVAGQWQVTPGTLPAYALRLMSFTWGGVDIFFVLSGYLVGSMLMTARDRGHGVLAVLVRRVFRIVPLYAVSFAAFLAFSATFPAAREGGMRWLLDAPMPLWSYALMLQNFAMAGAGEHGANWLGVTWSLALEVQFYLFLSAVIVAVPARALSLVLVALVVMAVSARVGMTLMTTNGGFAGFLLLPTRCDSVALGVLAAQAVADGRTAARFAEHGRLVLAGVAASLAIVIVLCAKGQGIGSLGMNAAGHLLLAAGSAAMIILLMTLPDGMIRRFFRTPVLVAFGTVSFGIYVFHQSVVGLLHHWFLGQVPRIANGLDAGVTALALVVTLALSYVSWTVFERPMIALGRSLTTPGAARTT